MRSVIVTGSTSGIGLGVAETFAKAGDQVVLNGIEPLEAVQPIIDKLKTMSGGHAVYSSADLSTIEGCHSLVETCLDAFGAVDVVVNNAGIQHKAPVEDFPENMWRKVIHLNLEAAFFISQKALPHMYTKGWGRLIHISSAHGLVASTEKAAYVAAKHGLLGLSKVIALEAAGRGVTSNCICPGWVLTPLVQKQIEGIAAKDGCSIDEAKHKLLVEKQPSKQFATPEEIGAATFFLASNEAAQITGTHLSVDGGWTAQ